MTASFQTTRWSLVARCHDGDATIAAKALGDLCEQYWYPLYAWLRRRGSNEHDAHDVLQSFCVQLLEHGGLDGAESARGSFRHYLLGALRHFVHNTVRAALTQKRGGGAVTLSLDDAEARYAAQATDGASPERLFERGWALALLARAHTRLHDEYAARNRSALLTALEPALLGDGAALSHADVARQLQTTEGGIKVALHRLRSRLRELIRDEVAQTLLDPGAVDEELRHLFAALRD